MKSRLFFVLFFCLISSFSVVAQQNEVRTVIQIMDTSEHYIQDLKSYYLDKYPIDFKNIDNVFSANSKSLKRRGKRYYYKHELTRAILLHDHYLKTLQAIPVFSELQNDSDLNKFPLVYEPFLFFAGSLCLDLERIDESIDFLKKSIIINESRKDSVRIKAALINIGIAFYRIENLDSTLYYYNKAKLLEYKGVEEYWENLAINFANVYSSKNDFKRVIEIYNGLIEEYEKESFPPDAALHYNLAVAYFEIDEIEKGFPLINLAETIAKSENEIDVLRNIYDTKSLVHQSLSNFELAIKYERLKDSVEELLPVESGSHLLDNLENQSKLAKKSAENYKVKTELGFLRQQKVVIVAFVALFVLIAIGYILFLRRKNARKMALVRSNLAQVLEKNKPRENAFTEKSRETSRNTDVLIHKIDNELKEKELFKKSNVSLAILAKRINSNTTEVSNVVNDYFGMSFRELINTLRIEEARKLLTDPKFDHYSIEGISQIVGYNSISSFNINFKKQTGITPSFYRKKSIGLR